MGALPQALEIIFEVQMKRSNEKIARKKKAFQLTKCIFSPFFLLFVPPSTLKDSNFLFSLSF
jgi:hypothetical protein